MELSEVHQLMQTGEYKQALNILESSTPDIQLDHKILKTVLLIESGELKKAASLAGETLKESRASGTDIQKLRALINQGWVYSFPGALSELQGVIEEAEKMLSSGLNVTDQETSEYQAWIHYLKAHIPYLKGEVNLTLDHSRKCLTLSEKTDNRHMMIKSLMLIGFMHLDGTGNQDLALDYFKKVLSIAEETGNKSDTAWSFYGLGAYHGSIGDDEKRKFYHEKSLAFYQELENRNMSAHVMNVLGQLHLAKEEYSLSIDYYRKALVIFEEYGRRNSMAMIYNNLGILYAATGNLDQAMEYYKQSLAINEEHGLVIRVSASLALISRIHTLKGELDHALDYINRSLSIAREIDHELAIAWRLRDLSIIYALKGEPELAMAEINESLQFFRKVDQKNGIAGCLVQQGINYKLLGKLKQAYESLEQGLEMFKKHFSKTNITNPTSHALFHLVLTVQDLENPEKAREYLEQLQVIQKTSKNKFVSLRARFAEAIVLKMSNRGFNIFQAQQIFQQIASEEIIDHGITMLALLNNCELLMLELKISTAGEVLLQEIDNIIQKIHKHAKQQNSSFLVIFSYFLQARLALVEGKLDDANKLLNACSVFAEEKKLGTVLVKVKKEQEQIQQELKTWEELSSRNASVKERIEQAKMINYILEAKRVQEAMVHSLRDDKSSVRNM